MHVAFAEISADYFITCDDKLLKKIRKLKGINMEGVNVLMEKLGPIETSRFLSFPPQKRMESVKRHQKWQFAFDKNKFLDDLFGSK